MHTLSLQIPFTKVDPRGFLKLHDAAAMMSDVCQFQEFSEVNFRDYLKAKNISIFLFSMQLDIFRVPEFRENITAAVKIYGCKSIYGLRRITLRDGQGKLCMIANATGAFFDTVAGKAVKLDPEDMPVTFEEAEPMECLPRKISVSAGSWQTLEPVKIQKSQLDHYGHLTSPEYFRLASDTLPDDFSYNRVRIEYKLQAKAGEIITPQIMTGSGRCFIDLKGGDGISRALLEFSTTETY